MPRKTKKLKITQIKSGIGKPQQQKNTLLGLGLKKLNKSVIRNDDSAIRGMVRKISHLVVCEEL